MGAPKSDLTLAKEELDFYYGIGQSKIFLKGGSKNNQFFWTLDLY